MIPLMDDPGYVRGTVPWSLDDLLETLAWTHALNETPKDDWDLAEQGFCMEGPGDGDINMRLNMFHPMNQVGMYFMRKYESPEAAYHLNRHMKIELFLSKHRMRLREDEWVRDCSEGDGGEDIASAILQALCVLEYTERDAEADIENWDFAYDVVMKKAEEIAQGERE
jgi:hypothetical protein